MSDINNPPTPSQPEEEQEEDQSQQMEVDIEPESDYDGENQLVEDFDDSDWETEDEYLDDDEEEEEEEEVEEEEQEGGGESEGEEHTEVGEPSSPSLSPSSLQKAENEQGTQSTVADDSNRIEPPEGDYCPICMESWSSDGTHQISCLPCGHVYGLSCIQRWIQQKGNRSKCPQCSRKCRQKDVIKLYISRTHVTDGVEQKTHDVVPPSSSWSCFYSRQEVFDILRRAEEAERLAREQDHIITNMHERERILAEMQQKQDRRLAEIQQEQERNIEILEAKFSAQFQNLLSQIRGSSSS